MLMPTNHATSPLPTIATSPPFNGPHVCHIATTTPPLIEGCGWMTSATSPTANDNCPCHITWKSTHCQVPHHKDQGSEECRKGSRRGKEEGEGERKGKPWVGRRAFVAPPSCSNVPEASKVVCISHTISFELFYPPPTVGGILSKNEVDYSPQQQEDSLLTMMEQCDGYHTAPISFHLTPPMMGAFLFCSRWQRWHDTHMLSPFSLRLLGGILHITSAMGVVWYLHALPILLCLPPLTPEAKTRALKIKCLRHTC